MLSKEALLGASDLAEREVELPSIGGSVRVRALPAAHSNRAISQALEMVTGRRGEQSARINQERLEILQAFHGLVEPKLSSELEAETFATNCGPAFKEVIRVIDELSGVDKEAIERAHALFQDGGSSEGSPPVGNGSSTGSS